MKFSNEQKRIITELDKNILLTAAAGTGKTNTLAYRIANIVEKGRAKTDEILCITFTNKASREMKDRIQKVIGSTGNQIVVKTFHSFCYDLIKEFIGEFTIYDEDDCKEVVKGVNYFSYSINSLQNFINEVKRYKGIYDFSSSNDIENYQWTINKLYSEEIKKIENICKRNYKIDTNMILTLKEKGAQIVNSYNTNLFNNNALDFQDLILLVKELLKNKETLKILSSRYKYINIDEVQDTSELEYSIIEKLFYKNNILLCGDPFQTIYEWRGSNPDEIFTAFDLKYNAERIVFKENYRNTKLLSDMSFDLLNNFFKDEMKITYKDGFKAVSNDFGEKIIFKELETIEEEGEYIYKEISKLRNNGSICILVRNNNYSIELSNVFSRLNRVRNNKEIIEFALVDQYKFFRRQEIKDILSFFRLWINRNDSLSLLRIIKRFNLGISERTLKELLSKESQESGIRIEDYLNSNLYEDGDIYEPLKKGFKKGNIVIFDVESTGTDVWKDEIIQIAAIKIDGTGNVIDSYERFLKTKKTVGDSEKVHGFSDLFIEKEGKDKKVVLEEFLHFINGSVVVGHNVNYDISILKSELERNKVSGLNIIEIYDTLELYRRYYKGLKNYKLETLCNIYETKNKPSHNAMDDILATGELLIKVTKEKIIPLEEVRRTLYKENINKFQSGFDFLERIYTGVDKLTTYEFLAEIVNRSNIKRIYNEDSKRVNKMREFYRIAKELYDENFSLEENITELLKLSSLSNGEMEILMANKNKIPIITVHQGKGLEFDYVFIGGLSQGVFPSFIADKEQNMKEEKRLFYVALTRAKKKAYLTRNNIYKGRQWIESELIKSIPKKYIQ